VSVRVRECESEGGQQRIPLPAERLSSAPIATPKVALEQEVALAPNVALVTKVAPTHDEVLIPVRSTRNPRLAIFISAKSCPDPSFQNESGPKTKLWVSKHLSS